MYFCPHPNIDDKQPPTKFPYCSIEGNPSLCKNVGACGKKKKSTATFAIILSATILVALMLLLSMLLFALKMRRRKQQGWTPGTLVRKMNKNNSGQLIYNENVPFQAESQQFTYMELEKITKSFQHEIGKGGFGSVYHGELENGIEVAVKRRSQSSSQGTKEFMAEIQLLMRIHHRNLVSLVGYCSDGNYLALVYEYMHRGSVQEHLRGKQCIAGDFYWGERLRIALEAAEGLEYLHKGCNPRIIHRDVKTSNILLSRSMEAKIADFGLSKVFHTEVFSTVSTVVVGTPGYLDPEYYITFQLTQKSDVYSFGVVLLELNTGQPAILSRPEQFHSHITKWVRPKLITGDIASLVDGRLEHKYDANSVWKALDIAMKCTSASSASRPTMSNVVAQLKEALAIEAGYDRSLERSLEYSIDARDTSKSGAFEIAQGVIGGPAAR